ncbi:hypothetical protein Vretifemale_16717 [Volvox reticuliferus]|uniref:Uncharacterized protein n=1 Tax=Volvox reticuliferus TaxID=1737510 RepID=A0A8J4CUA5_9CHLO|nr:hypothetical protein Vretifemale_16717 [Volvox reticuliferus]
MPPTMEGAERSTKCRVAMISAHVVAPLVTAVISVHVVAPLAMAVVVAVISAQMVTMATENCVSGALDGFWLRKERKHANPGCSFIFAVYGKASIGLSPVSMPHKRWVWRGLHFLPGTGPGNRQAAMAPSARRLLG